MAVAKTLNVSREKLIAKLEEKVEALKARIDVNFRNAVDEERAAARKTIRNAEAVLAELESVKNMDQLREISGLHRYYSNHDADDLTRDIELLKMSDQETIAVGPMSNFYKYL